MDLRREIRGNIRLMRCVIKEYESRWDACHDLESYNKWEAWRNSPAGEASNAAQSAAGVSLETAEKLDEMIDLITYNVLAKTEWDAFSKERKSWHKTPLEYCHRERKVEFDNLLYWHRVHAAELRELLGPDKVQSILGDGRAADVALKY